jgi:hypothetical protein
LAYEICAPMMNIGCCVIFLFVKSICTDLDSLSLIRHLFVQIATLFTTDYSFLVELSTVSPTAMTAVSSANVAVVLFNVVGTSLI